MGRRAAVALLAACASARAAVIDDVLARMDSAAKSFKSYSAAAKVLDYTKYADDTFDTFEQNGSFRLRRTNNAIFGIMDLTAGRNRTVVHFNGPAIEFYAPKTKEVRVYKTGQYGALLNAMLLLGFSVTRDEMKKNYDVRLGDGETLDSTPATHLVLTPKSAEALKVVKTIELWIPDGKGYAIQQKENAPSKSKDYRLVRFSNLQLNPPLPDSEFELVVPKDVKRVRMN